MTTRDTLLRAIAHDPADDTPRLVYADWLEESGDDFDQQHAELIRVQCELTHWRATQHGEGFNADRMLYLSSREDDLLTHVVPVVRRGAKCKTCDGKGKVLGASVYGYSREKEPCPDCHGGYTGMLAGMLHGRFGRVVGSAWRNRCDFSRGFPWRVHCTLAEYQREVGRISHATLSPVTWAEALLREHGTITEVVLTDREPQPRGDGWFGWFQATVGTTGLETDYDVPPEIFKYLPMGFDVSAWCDFRSSDLATQALARAAADHTRELAGLPKVWVPARKP